MRTSTALRAAGLLVVIGCGQQAEDAAPELAAVAARPAAHAAARTIVCLGDSLTAGYGVDLADAWPALLAEHVQDAGLDYDVVNAGVSGDTTSGGLRRLDWILRGPVDLIVIALGGNDGLRGIDVATVEGNLAAMIDAVRERRPDATIVLAGMQAPPNMGKDFTEPFRAIYPRVAREQDVRLVPFLLEGVAAEPELNQADGIHPNEAGHERIAAHLWEAILPLLRGT